ncbi:MAG: DUF4416 family protein [Candidatus Omnitrophota bacterium]
MNSVKRKHAKLLVGLIFRDPGIYLKTQKALERKFGSIGAQSQVFDFNYTEYYKDELGSYLKRRFLVFEKPVDISGMDRVKNYAMGLERLLSVGGKRTVNIDPGYLTAAKLVLTTRKDYSHRIYLRNGVYAEVTLFFRNKSFEPFPWTFPDYRSEGYLGFFNRVRQEYKRQLS